MTYGENGILEFFKCYPVAAAAILAAVAVVLNIKESRRNLESTQNAGNMFLVLLPQIRTYAVLISLNVFVSTWLQGTLIISTFMKQSIAYLTVSPATGIIISLCSVGFTSPIDCFTGTLWQKCAKELTAMFAGWALSLALAITYSFAAPSLVESLIDLVNSYSNPLIGSVLCGICCIALCLSTKANPEPKLMVVEGEKYE